jgi:outer membrane receptor protein involved in Fe transport
MKSVVRMIASSLLAAITLVVPLQGQTTGKIAGIITDRESREPLVGASVVLAGTTIGAATDIAGRYTILDVPPGTYRVQISCIGYEKLVISDVRVFIDQTTRLNSALRTQAIEVGEVVVVAERKIIKPDIATSVVDVSGSEITELPAVNVQDVISMQAGVQGMGIRGGSSDEALFMLDGVTMRDPRNNQPVTKVALSSVKEISVERGGFTAEYGQVQSGIVKVVTYEGKPKGYSGSVNVRLTPPAPKYYRGGGIPDVNDPNSYWLRPFFDPAVCWTGTNNGAWDLYTKKQYLPFDGWNAVSKALLTDDNPNNDLTPLGAQRAFEYETRKRQINNEPDYVMDAGFGGPVPFVSEELGNLRFYASYRGQRELLLFPQSRPDYTDYDARIVLNADIAKSMKFRLSGLTGNVATMEDNWNKGYYPQSTSAIANGTGGDVLLNLYSDMAYSLTDIGHRSAAAKLTHVVSDKTYYEVSLEYFRTKYFSRPPAARDTSQKFEIFPGFFETSNPYGYFPGISDGVVIKDASQESLARDNSIAHQFTLKADITSQVDFSNEVKAGAELVYNDLKLDYGFIQMQTGGNSYASRVQMENFPLRGGFYLQDKLETNGFILNAGLRLDYSNSQSNWWSYNPYDQGFYSYRYNPQQVSAEEKSKGQWQLSPRLGISHPITENSKLYFNYGHFKQMPQYESLFRVDRRTDGSLARIGDPNLTLAKTISYELGFDQQLFDNTVLIQLTAYYRDISNQQNTTTYTPIFGQSYTVTTSNSYQDIRGFELTIRKSPGRWYSGFINYTYQTYSGGNFGEGQLFQDPSQQQAYDENTVNLYQTRYKPTPYARANLIFSTPADFGPELLGHNVLGDFLVSFLLNWNQGGWTTYNPLNAPGVSNNARYVDYFDGVLRASKSLKINRFTIQLFADVYNLFNAQRLRNTGDPDYRRSLHLPKSSAYNNIPGDDKFGDYRTPGVEWQPIEYQADMSQTKLTAGSTRAIYYEAKTGQYWQYANNQSIPVAQRWTLVDQNRIDQINKDKAYIYMPNPSTFWFLNPRAATFGLRISFDLD